MSWLLRPLIALDTETTGTDPETARIVQICVGISTAPGEWSPFTTLVNPGAPIPAAATAVHGITDEMVADAPTVGDVLRDLERWWGSADGGTPVVAHHAAYDLTVLDREARRAGVELEVAGWTVLDTLCLHRRFDWRTGGRSLGRLAARYNITFPAHDAEADALAALRLLHILAGENDLLPMIDPTDLHRGQQRWWVQQQDAIESKQLGNGSEFTRQDHWPLIPMGVES